MSPFGLFSRGGLRFPLNLEELAQGPENDAGPYGVFVRQPAASPGDVVFRVLRVHHLTPEENRGQHHIFVDVLDEEGRRIPDTEVRIAWVGGSQVVRLDPDPFRPGVAFPMDKWNVYEVEVVGEPSARVVGLTAGHPPEGRGNPEFRHSFLVVFQRQRVPMPEVSEEETPPPSAEEITTPEPGGIPVPEPAPEAPAVPKVQEEVAAMPDVEEQPLTVDVAPEPSSEELLSAAPAEQEQGEAGEETPVPPTVEAVAPPEVEMEVPAAPSPERTVTQPSALETYVLFVGAEAPSTVATFFVVMDDLLQMGVPFGFDAIEAAAAARRVIVVGDAPASLMEELRARGCDVIPIEEDGLRAR